MQSQPDEPLNPYASPKSEVAPRSVEGHDALAQGEVLRLEGSISPKDLFHANKLAGRQTPSDAVGCLVVLVFVLLPWGLLLSQGAGPTGGLVTALFGLGIAVVLVVKALLKMRQINRYWRVRRGVCQPQRIEISDADVRQQTQAGWSVYRWSAFSKYSGSARVVLLHFDPPSEFMYEPPHAFLVVPRSLFGNQWDWDRFVRLVHQRLPGKYHEGRAG